MHAACFKHSLEVFVVIIQKNRITVWDGEPIPVYLYLCSSSPITVLVGLESKTYANLYWGTQILESRGGWKSSGEHFSLHNIHANTECPNSSICYTFPPPTRSLLLLLQAQHLPLSQHHIKHYGLRLLLMSLHMLHHGLFAHTKNQALIRHQFW